MPTPAIRKTQSEWTKREEEQKILFAEHMATVFIPTHGKRPAGVITGRVLEQLPEKELSAVTQIFNAIISTGYFHKI